MTKNLVLFFLLTANNAFAQTLTLNIMAGGLYELSANKTTHPPAETVKPLVAKEGVLPFDIAEQAKALSNSNQRVALALVDKGEVVYKYRANGVSDTTLIPSFSMAKSLTSIMVGYALCEGKIKDLNEKVSEYVPELAETVYGKASIRNVLQMASGSSAFGAHGEPYQGFSTQVRQQKISQLESLLKYKDQQSMLFKKVEPGETFNYKNLDTATLSLVIEKATQQPFHSWYETTLVKNAGLANPSGWLLDKDGRAISYAYFFATQDDWIRLAIHTLELIKGQGGTCMQDYMNKASSDRIRVNSHPQFSEYGYQFWAGVPGQKKEMFWKTGFGGQIIGVDPITERMVVMSSTDWNTQVFSLLQNWSNKN
jgi:CubicO group peptidase (beta-lactamase class C family)